MEAKDTEMTADRLKLYHHKIITKEGKAEWEISRLIADQAEITWDKAIREVVEWGEEWCTHTTADDAPQFKRECDKCWQAKLKEWNIEKT